MIYDNNIKKKLSSLLSFFYNKIQKDIIAITGTNGKTSVSWYVFQFLSINNINSSYLGTLGQFLNGKKVSDLENTTPDICSIYNFSQEHLLSKEQFDLPTIELKIIVHRERLRSILQ